MWIRRKEWDDLCAEVRKLKQQRVDDQLELTQRISMRTGEAPWFGASIPMRPVTEVVEAILGHLKLNPVIVRSTPERMELKPITPPPSFSGELCMQAPITKRTKTRNK